MEDNKKKKSKSAERAIAPKKLKLLVLIVNTNKADFYTDFLQSFEVNLQLQMNARGTAGSEMLHYLDVLDAKMYDMEDALLGIQPGDFSERVWTLNNRTIYKRKNG
jgi:hypothetical protein